MICMCLNLTFANVVRFPRELDRYGVIFLLPYLLLFLLIGIPIILLEIALGQFLGQGAAHAWRASPIFRGKYKNTQLLVKQKLPISYSPNTVNNFIQLLDLHDWMRSHGHFVVGVVVAVRFCFDLDRPIGFIVSVSFACLCQYITNIRHNRK